MIYIDAFRILITLVVEPRYVWMQKVSDSQHKTAVFYNQSAIS